MTSGKNRLEPVCQMDENEIKRQSWDSNRICMIQSLLVPSHASLPNRTAPSGEQNSWGTSDVLQLIKLRPSPLGPRDAT